MDSNKIIGAVTGVTKTWTKQRKAEERKASAVSRRREVMMFDRPTTIQDAAYAVMEEAYMKASANGTLPALARQIMYAGCQWNGDERTERHLFHADLVARLHGRVWGGGFLERRLRRPRTPP